MENSPTSDVHKSSAKWPTMKELVDPKKWQAIMKELVDPNGPFIRKWKVIFLISCVFAVLLDPLFLYIPIIMNEQDIKCLRSDNKLKIAALVLRSVTDLCYLLNIFFQVYRISTANSSALRRRIRCSSMVLLAKAKTLWRSYILIDILAVLPIPQIIILIFYFNTRGDSRSFGTRKLMNFFVLVQYVPRVLRIYLSCKEFMKSFGEEISIWLKGVLNFFLFILASHVIGAFWYFFAIQQIATCWQYTCRPKNGCDPSNLYCHDHHHHALRNIKLVDDMCSVDPPNEKLFKIGIFHDIVQLGILGSTDFFEKLSNCFWWGLRNLSSFGSNLNSSISAWENIFGAFISIVGLLLFLYLIGNLQTYMQLDTQRSETQRLERRIAKKMEKKGPEVDRWLSKNGIPSSKKSEIMDYVKLELQAKEDVDVENIDVSDLPSELKSSMESCMPLNRLKKVPLLQNMDEGVLKAISEYLKPVKYSNNDIIIKEKEPLQNMIFIVEGFVLIEMKDCSSTLKRSAGEVYGEKLLSWPAWTSFPALPVATESVKADGDVEALVLMASDIQDVGQKFRSYFFNKEINTRLTDDEWELLETDLVTMLRKVPKLETMNGRVLKDISKNLKSIKCERDTFIITEGKPLRKMVFVMRGSLHLKKNGGWTNEKGHKGEFYGEELLDWVLDRSFPAILPISIHDIWVHNAEVLVLTAKDLGNFKSHFSKDIISPTDSSLDQLDLCATVGLTWLKKGPSIFQSMEEEMLKVISKRLELQSYSVDSCIVQKNNPLEYIFIYVEGSNMSIESSLGPCALDIGDFYGQELVHWVTYWSSHTTFSDKFPLSTSTVKVSPLDETGYAGVLVLRVNALKSLVSEFRRKFIKPFNLPVDSEGKLLAFDSMATLKKVKDLEGMDETKLEEIRRHTKYNDTCIIQSIHSGIDKMFVIESGVVSVRSIKGGEKIYRYSGDYFGDELLDWALRPSPTYSRNRSLPKSDVCVEAVGEVEVLELQADDLKSLFRDDNINSVDQHVGSSSKIKGVDDNVDSSKVQGQKVTEPSPIVHPSPPRPRYVGSSSSSEQKKIDDDVDSSKDKGKKIAEPSSPPYLPPHDPQPKESKLAKVSAKLKETHPVKGMYQKLKETHPVKGMYKKLKESSSQLLGTRNRK